MELNYLHVKKKDQDKRDSRECKNVMRGKRLRLQKEISYTVRPPRPRTLNTHVVVIPQR